MPRQAAYHAMLAGAGLALAFALALSGCTASTVAAPATPPPTAPLTNVAGQYTGTVTDRTFGKGSAFADFSQSGSSVGGRLRFNFPALKVLSSAAMILTRSNALTGSATATIGESACTFSLSGSYDPSTFILAGAYAATHGCSGQSGNFQLAEQCYYTTLSRLQADALRPNAGLHGC